MKGLSKRCSVYVIQVLTFLFLPRICKDLVRSTQALCNMFYVKSSSPRPSSNDLSCWCGDAEVDATSKLQEQKRKKKQSVVFQNRYF